LGDELHGEFQDKFHGGSLRWWVWVEDPALDRLHHRLGWREASTGGIFPACSSMIGQQHSCV
jgi:hypothetical protein